MRVNGGPVDRRGDVRRDRLLAREAARCLRELDAAAVIVYLRVPGERALAAAVVAVTPMGVYSPLERVSLDDQRYASATAYRTGRVATAHSTEILERHPELAVLTPFPYVVMATELRGPAGATGAVTATWPEAAGAGPVAGREALVRAAGRMSAVVERFAALGVPAEPAAVPLVVPGDHEPGPASTDPPPGGVDVPTAYHVHKLAVRLATVTETGEAAEEAVERITQGFGAEAVALSLVESGRLHVVGASGCSSAWLRRLNGMPLSRPSLETLAVAAREQITEPAGGRASGRFAREEAEDRDHVWFVLPLLAGGRATGTCSVGYPARPGGTAGVQGALTSLATLLGQTFERTRVLDARRALAQQLQETLLPRMLPQVAGVLTTCRYAPAGGAFDLGGDWYDVIELPGGEVAAVVGDVEGHNIAAAVVMGQLRSAVRAFAGEGHDPATVLTRTNRLLNDLAGDLLATCCCVWLDPGTGEVRVATAGHVPPLIREENGHYPVLDVDIGVPLGVEADPVYRAAEQVVRPGTLVVLHSDGLSGDGSGMTPAAFESAFRTAGGEMEDLGDLLVGESSPHPSHEDDRALLLLRYEGAPADVRGDVRGLEIPRHDLAGVRRARRFLRESLDGWDLGALADDAELLACEVVTNALVHGDSEVDVRLRRYPRKVRVEVRDCAPRPAVPVTVLREEDQAESGRGLVIVAALAAAWGNSPSGRGKTVWFELGTP
ncbi:ATP-binding SpoIIE family protein phosphatase [Streptomyces sp. NPDC004658]|uniref:ATP-binding SpoIIE family protein phosphatase n=1 Tax=Streptomyces sp. NPDC004658 TaxID=3154672 RepID=UPI0033A075A5